LVSRIKALPVFKDTAKGRIFRWLESGKGKVGSLPCGRE
jgi:hypothetical protein